MSTTRITKQQLDELAAHVSRCFTGELHVVVEGRYGYTAIDLYDAHGCVRTVTAGLTKRQAHDYLGAMMSALEIVGRGDES